MKSAQPLIFLIFFCGWLLYGVILNRGWWFQIKKLLYGWWALEKNASRPPHVINSGIAHSLLPLNSQVMELKPIGLLFIT